MAQAFQCDRCKQFFSGDVAVKLHAAAKDGRAFDADLCDDCAQGFEVFAGGMFPAAPASPDTTEPAQ